MKCPISGQWLDALIYQDYGTRHLYVRERKDFFDKFDKFVKLVDWEKGGSNNKQGVSGPH